MWQSDTVILKNKLTANNTYLTTTNYWAPLYDEEDKVKKPEQIKIITAKQLIANTKSSK